MGRESQQTEDFHIEYPATDGKVIGFPDLLLGIRYVWKETKPVATTIIKAPRYRLLKPGSVADVEGNKSV